MSSRRRQPKRGSGGDNEAKDAQEVQKAKRAVKKEPEAAEIEYDADLPDYERIRLENIRRNQGEPRRWMQMCCRDWV